MSLGKLTKNTAALFARQMVALAVSLYTIRTLLTALGVTDFALFSVVSNVVMLGSFLPGAMGMITQRYFSFAIGKCDPEALKRVHDASFVICVGVSILIVLGLETIGTWFVSHYLNVAPDKLDTAKLLFQFIVISFTISSISGFYSSIIMAHEDMHIYAAFSLGDAFLRLLAVLAINFLSGDLLIVYGILQCAVAIVILLAYLIYCRRSYSECRTGSIRFEKVTLREMVGFAGWTVFGQITSISRNQAVTILINQAFNPATVAARALASSVASQVLTFSANFSSALHPPIIKAHAASDKEQMFSLIFAGSKITFFLVWIATLPIMMAMPGILRLWLGSYPEQTVYFTRLALIENAVTAVSFPLMTAVRAVGKMQVYELSLGGLQFLVLLFSWLLVRAGYPAYSVYIVAIAINLVMFAVRLAIVSRQTGLPCGLYMRWVMLPVMLVVVSTSGLAAVALWLAPWVTELRPFPTSAAMLGLVFLLTIVLVYLLGLTQAERDATQALIGRRLAKFRNPS